MQDELYMACVLKLATRGRFITHPSPNVGCVIVKGGGIVGEGYHHRVGEPHVEVHALRTVGEKAQGTIAYVTLKPCSHHGRTPPCCDALIAAGVSCVAATMQDPDPQVVGRGFYRLQQAGIDVSHGLTMNEAKQLNKGSLKCMRTGFPYLQLKLGASLDGHTAMASGESWWIISPQARHDVQRLHAQSRTILTNSSTVLADDPQLTARWSELGESTQASYPQEELRQPIRIVLDSRNQVIPECQIAQQPGETWIVWTEDDPCSWPETVRSLKVPKHNGYLDLVALMIQLGKQQINSIWAETGLTLAGVLLQVDLVDELIVYAASKLLGSDARELRVLSGPEKLADAPHFKFNEIHQVGPDVCLYLTVARGFLTQRKQRTEYYDKIRPLYGAINRTRRKNINIIGANVATPDARVAITTACFNNFINGSLLEGAIDALKRISQVKDKNITVVWVLGAHESPLTADVLAKTGRYDAVTVFGTVICGGIAHFEYVAGGASNGLAHVAQDSGILVVFGVLTTESIEQAIERAGTKVGNKGAEAALTAPEMINVLKVIKA